MRDRTRFISDDYSLSCLCRSMHAYIRISTLQDVHTKRLLIRTSTAHVCQRCMWPFGLTLSGKVDTLYYMECTCTCRIAALTEAEEVCWMPSRYAWKNHSHCGPASGHDTVCRTPCTCVKMSLTLCIRECKSRVCSQSCHAHST
jgi:hypothetical protein